ncbi:GAF domain-containing protein [Paenibacillus alginolyticus]|uniref:GAF domain-containing protein n=1 Tax=Paenibacillus alginolyticus TaxID=59839 RepID=A0ABT4G7J2_9BACL|nr:GAF domain-containing protein [Paenibacillus alginolyticus]MCY9665313.1 GAF domain-containing protein [Paenibacillus alginolyticus]MCY9692125.1 GAF domain-containing protein [Paenibacillus alginolyticus]MEC0147891.1 GAF domain-containing protein [Paenibacillus alginolyticus]
MFTKSSYEGTREDHYALLIQQVEALIHDEPNRIANLANAAALLGQFLSDVNWVGFYLLDETSDKKELVLGPFQGLPACVRIPLGKGVCGTSAERRETVLVPDVHAFPGHIACDAASQSEIVVPILVGNELVGVLDIDSPIKSRFDDIDQQYLEQFVQKLAAAM